MFQLSQDSVSEITKFESTKQGWVLLLNDKHCCRIWLWFSSLTPLSTIVQLYHLAVSFIGGGNRSIWRKSLTCHKSLTNFIT